MSPFADVLLRGDLAFPKSLPQFQKLFPNDAACAAYLGMGNESPTYDELYSGTWEHPRVSDHG